MSSSATSETEAEGPLVILGEVRTCLLQNSSALPQSAVIPLMRLTRGLPVTSVERPMERVLSPDQATGVDCRMALATDGRARAIGTVLAHAVVTGGRVLQGSAQTGVVQAVSDRRQPWAHYLRTPGVIEVVGRYDTIGVVDGYLTDDTPAHGLDLGSIAGRIVEHVQDGELDHDTSLRARPTLLRWAASLQEGGAPKVGIRKELTGNMHTVRMTGSPSDLGLIVRFCEDLALHEWLLTTISQVIAKADRPRTAGHDPRDALEQALEQLVHLWMPAVHVSASMRSLWGGVESMTGYGILWQRNVARIRDQIMLRRPPTTGYRYSGRI